MQVIFHKADSDFLGYNLETEVSSGVVELNSMNLGSDYFVKPFEYFELNVRSPLACLVKWYNTSDYLPISLAYMYNRVFNNKYLDLDADTKALYDDLNFKQIDDYYVIWCEGSSISLHKDYFDKLPKMLRSNTKLKMGEKPYGVGFNDERVLREFSYLELDDENDYVLCTTFQCCDGTLVIGDRVESLRVVHNGSYLNSVIFRCNNLEVFRYFCANANIISRVASMVAVPLSFIIQAVINDWCLDYPLEVVRGSSSDADLKWLIKWLDEGHYISVYIYNLVLLSQLSDDESFFGQKPLNPDLEDVLINLDGLANYEELLKLDNVDLVDLIRKCVVDGDFVYTSVNGALKLAPKKQEKKESILRKLFRL